MIYGIMIIFSTFFITAYLIAVISDLNEAQIMHRKTVASFYLFTASLVGASSFRFISDINRNFNSGCFQEASNNVKIIALSIIFSFSFNFTILIVSSPDSKRKTWKLIMANL